MSRFVRQTAIETARHVSLYDFLLSKHPKKVIQEGDSLRLRCDHSVSIKEGYCGFYDFEDGSHGNSVTFLTDYLDYEFTDAVTTLCAFAEEHPDLIVNIPDTLDYQAPANTSETIRKPSKAAKQPFTPPEPIEGQYRQLVAYLTQQRGFPSSIVQALIKDGLLYQTKHEGYNNIVFIDPDRTFTELRGTNSYKSFHRAGCSDKTAFWWFKPRGIKAHATRAYVCEGAIDAISLYLYMSLWDENKAEEAMYCGIGGVANQQRIDRIKAGMAEIGGETVMAVDNDDAGKKCRERNADCAAVIPRLKDWNEDLLDFMEKHIDLNIGAILNQKVRSHRDMG